MTPTIAAVALGWLGRDSRARIMLTPGLDVIWRSPAADALLAASVGIHIRDGRLSLANPHALRMMTAFVAGLEHDIATLTVPHGDGQAGMIIRGLLIDSPSGPVACLEIITDAEDTGARYGDLDAIFALTPAEHRVLLAMLGGHNVPALAARLGVSLETVRTHVRRIYAKIGVGSREALFSKLQPYRTQ